MFALTEAKSCDGGDPESDWAKPVDNNAELASNIEIERNFIAALGG
jgi:hypothetical protein